MIQKVGPILRVATVDDSPVIAKRLEHMLNEVTEVDYVGNASTISKALQLVQNKKPHIIILDLHLKHDMPHANGLNLLMTLKKLYPELIVIMLTNHIEAQYRNTCLAFGAAHFLDKSNDVFMIPDLLKNYYQHFKVNGGGATI